MLQLVAEHLAGPASTWLLATHAPALLQTLLDFEQSTHAWPLTPHVAVDWPPWQTLSESQQPPHCSWQVAAASTAASAGGASVPLEASLPDCPVSPDDPSSD